MTMSWVSIYADVIIIALIIMHLSLVCECSNNPTIEFASSIQQCGHETMAFIITSAAIIISMAHERVHAAPAPTASTSVL